MKYKRWKLNIPNINMFLLLLSLFLKNFVTADNLLTDDSFGNRKCFLLHLKNFLPHWEYYSLSNSDHGLKLLIVNDHKLYSSEDCTTNIPNDIVICLDLLNLLPNKSYLKGHTCFKIKSYYNVTKSKTNFRISMLYHHDSYKLWLSSNSQKMDLAQIFHNYSRTKVKCRNHESNYLSVRKNKLYTKQNIQYYQPVTLPLHCVILFQTYKRPFQLSVQLQRKNMVLKRKRRFVSLAFEKSFYEENIKENSPQGTVVVTLKVTGGSGSYIFTKIEDHKTDDKFEIEHDSGEVRVLQNLDREGGTPMFSLDFKATDTVDKSLTATVSVSVKLLDVNDNAPKFDKSSYEREIDEEQGEKYILTVRASDADDGINREIVYRIIKNKDVYCPFTIDSKTGAITNTDRLDREQNPFFVFNVTAQDQGKDPKSLSATVVVNVTLKDINDNEPKFPKSIYKVTIPESTKIGTTILKLNATDADIGSNGEIIYNTNSYVSLFEVNRATGEVILRKSVDYDRFQRSSKFTVAALDQGKPPLFGRADVEITIEDVNDNAPVFTRKEFIPSLPIPEDIEIGKLVYKLSARDADSGSNGKISYVLGDGVPSTLPFSLDKTSGEITVKGKLDYEKQTRYQFNVVAIDGGIPAKNDTAVVIVPISNVNDNNPRFKNSTYSIEISENKQKGEPIITVEAEDPDQLTIQNFDYSIGDGNSDNCFHIDQYYGVVVLKCDLDYKTKNHYQLKLKVVDGDNKPGFAVLNINVFDANNNAPMFSSDVITLHVKEDVAVGSVVGQVNATDDDSGDNARISYSCDSKTFNIDTDTGEITTKKKLDRETENSFTLTITAMDHGKPFKRSGRTTVVITVEDVNDNAPEFKERNYTFQIDEDVKMGTLVGSVHATDDDQDLNKEIKYYFKNESDVLPFLIKPESGTISTTKLLDREVKASYKFQVIAVDQGIKPLNSSVPVTVLLKDVQDSDPVFTQRIYNFTIDENSNVEVGRVRATLADSDFRTSLFYTISKNSRNNMFGIDRSQGVIRPIRPLDYEQENTYQLNVRVQTLRGRTDIAVVNIKVQDVNDHPPVLEDFYIFLNIFNGTFNPIFQIPAYDPDVSSLLAYTIESGNDHDFVNLSQDSGQLYLKRSILNTASEIEIGFKVTDGEFTTRAIGRITISDVSNVMIKNSISIVLKNATRDKFLKTEILHKFKQSLAKAFNCDSKRIFILSIEDFVQLPKYSRQGSMLEVSIAVREEEKDSYMSSIDLKNKLYFSKEQFEKEFGLFIYTFDFSGELCSVEYCKNFQTCTFQLTSRKNHTTIRSRYVTFRGISIQAEPKCECKIDQYYNGPRHDEICGKSYNLCYKISCGKFGTCVGTDTGFVCICHPNYFGKYCQIHRDESICPRSNAPETLSENPCGQNGACASKLGKGFECKCNSAVETDTDLCVLSTRYFTKGSFVAFNGLKQRWNVHITMDFRTTEANAVLLYNGRFTNMNDFISIEIVDGQLVCTVSFGRSQEESVTSVLGFVPGGINDGLWHTVKVQLKNQKLSIAAGALCDLDTAEKLNPDGKKKYCAASKYVTGTMKSLDLTGPLIIGGMPDIERKILSPSSNFIGCIRNITIDFVKLDLSDVLYNNKSQAGCPFEEDGKCSSVPLENPCEKGFCTNVTIEGDECLCDDAYTGKRCDIATTTVTLTKESELFVSHSQSSGTGLNAWSHSLSIKTSALHAILFEETVNNDRGYLKISNGYVAYTTEASTLLNLTSVFVSNSKWHRIKLEWTNNQLSLSIGYQGNHVVSIAYWFSTIRVDLSRFGGDGDDAFAGCLKDFKYSGKQVNLMLTQNKNVKRGCIETDLCKEKDCGANGYCDLKYGVASCICNKGYKGPDCVSVCAENPCNKGTCIKTSSRLSGFSCKCPVNYTGNYCETRLTAKCDPGYFGIEGLCGPCQCDTHENFNSTCDPDGTMEENSIPGKCFCNDGFYSSQGTCMPCRCLTVGSQSFVCDKKTGQCLCKPKVIGRRCDQCPGAWQEIVRGCSEINNSCPKTYSDGIWWDRIPPGGTRMKRCPFNAVGNVTRYCNPRTSWDPPKFFDCTSQLFAIVQSMLKPILSGAKKLQKSVAISMSYKLEFAVNNPKLSFVSHPFYGKDIEIGYEALKLMIAYEGNQTGGFLVSSEDSGFIRNLMSSASRLFSTDVTAFWDTIQKTHPGTAGLMKEMENFVSILARNLAYVKRRRSRRAVELTPYSQSFDNIYFEIQPIVKEDNKTYVLPRLRQNSPVNVMINKKLFEDNPTLRYMEQINVGMVIYKTLGDLLPQANSKKYTMKVLSDVFTLTIPDVKDIYSDEEITMVFTNVEGLNNTEFSVHCMFWNYSLRATIGGGWSDKGCRTYIEPNSTEVICYCNHLTSFALVGVKHTEVIPRTYQVHYLTYIGLVVSMCLLIFVFFVFMYLRQLKSNANSIHKNLALVACLGWLVFCLTINRTQDGERSCRVYAILIHYFMTCTFSWLMVEALHMYRMILEPRDINYGQMMFYYFIGWGAPVVVVGVTTGLKPSGYETSEFCWINLRDTEMIWTYTAPILAIIAGNILMLLLALTSSCEKVNIKKKKAKLSRIRYRLAISFFFLVIIILALVSGLIVVSYDDALFVYLFPAACVVQGLYMLLFYVIFNRKVRREAKNAYIRLTTDDKSYGLKPPPRKNRRFAEKESLINQRYAHVFEAFNIDSTSSNESSDTMDGRRRARKRIAGSDSTDFPTTLGESSDSSDDDSSMPSRARRGKQTDTDSDSSDNSSGVDDYSSANNGNAKLPPNVEWKQATQKKLALSRTYASDGPMHSTPSESEASEKKWSKVGFTPTKINTSELSAIPSESDNATPTRGQKQRVKGPKGPMRIINSSNSDSDTPSQAKAPVSILKKKSQYDSNGHRLRAVRVKDFGSGRKPLMSLNDSVGFNDSQV